MPAGGAGNFRSGGEKSRRTECPEAGWSSAPAGTGAEPSRPRRAHRLPIRHTTAATHGLEGLFDAEEANRAEKIINPGRAGRLCPPDRCSPGGRADGPQWKCAFATREPSAG